MAPVLSRFQFEIYDQIGPGISCYNAEVKFDREGQPVQTFVSNSSHYTLASAIPYEDFQTAAGFYMIMKEIVIHLGGRYI